MDHLLNNPNKIKMVIIPVYDDLFGDNWELGIAHKRVFILFKNNRTTVNFDSRVLNQRNIME